MRHVRWVHHIMINVPFYKVTEQLGQSCILHCSWLLLIVSETGVPMCVGVCKAQNWCNSPTPVKPMPKGSGSEIMPWVDSGLATIQCQTSKTSLGWINGKLQFLPWMSTGASTEHRWRLQVTCSESGCLQDCVCVFGRRCRCFQPINATRQQTEWLPQLLMELSHGCKTIGCM